MCDEIVAGKVIMYEVIDRAFVGLNVRSYFNVLLHNRFDVRQRDAFQVERPDLAGSSAALHERYDRTLLALDSRHSGLAALSRANPDLIDFHYAAQLVDHSMLRH